MKLTAVVIMIVINIIALTINIIEDGKPRTNFNAVHSFIAFIIAMLLYYFAGLFDVFIC